MKKYCNNSSYFKFQRNKDVKYKKGFPFGKVHHSSFLLLVKINPCAVYIKDTVQF